jgi:hypothetical protein
MRVRVSIMSDLLDGLRVRSLASTARGDQRGSPAGSQGFLWSRP